MKYYIKHSGKTYGPVEESKIKSRIKSGFFSYNDLVSTDLKEWKPQQQELKTVLPGGLQKNVAAPVVPKATPHLKKAIPKVAKASGGMVHKVVKANVANQSNSTLIIILVVISLLLVAGIGAVVYFVFFANEF